MARTGRPPLHTQCAVDGCERPHACKGYCHMHYQKWKRLGDPTAGAFNTRRHGEGTIRNGYVVHVVGGKPKAEHVLVAERAFGKPLPAGAIVHHVDENRLNNAPANLVICPDNAYHRMLHMRMKAMAGCGNPDFRRCRFCGKWSPIETLTRVDGGDKGASHHHKACNAEAARSFRAKKEARHV